ncbi:hypothetical protein [Protofrankia symbiont of Coriaria ruscifolia]|nr:hypothetical protein [Protofrankia symbiont of Coriaria ruscifolia]
MIDDDVPVSAQMVDEQLADSLNNRTFTFEVLVFRVVDAIAALD